MEKAAERIDAKLRAASRTVTVIEPADSTEFAVTFPQGKRPAAKAPAELAHYLSGQKKVKAFERASEISAQQAAPQREVGDI